MSSERRDDTCANLPVDGCDRFSGPTGDPEGIYLVTTVDIADTDEVMAVVGDRLLELQVEKGLPVYGTPLRPIERVVAPLREREAAVPSLPLPRT